jgi:hypothetical protein
MLIDAEHHRRRWEERLEAGKSLHPHETGPRVMRPAFGVVPMGHDGQLHLVGAEEVEAGCPVQGAADLIDFVHRQRVTAEGDGRRAGEHQLRALLPSLKHGRQDRGISQVIDRVGRAAGAGDDVVRLGQRRQCLRLGARQVVATGKVPDAVQAPGLCGSTPESAPQSTRLPARIRPGSPGTRGAAVYGRDRRAAVDGL